MKLSKLQKEATDAVLDWINSGSKQYFYLAGYAGTGKTTILKNLIEEAKKEPYNVKNYKACAFTGKAAYVMRCSGIDDAQTLHSAIYNAFDDAITGKKVFVLNRKALDKCDLVILDEMSMVDEKLAQHLFSYGVKVLAIGDPGQLPAVQGKGFFEDKEPDFFLEEIHRQSLESPIIKLATMARCGEYIGLGDYGKGVSVAPFDASSASFVLNSESQVICGTNKTRMAINNRIRKHLGINFAMPVEGDLVVNCKNNKDLGIFNGQTGKIDAVLSSNLRQDARVIELVVDFDGQGTVELNTSTHLFRSHHKPTYKSKIDRRVCELDYGYCLTAHKAQGSQFDYVVGIDESDVFENKDKWLYTLITRAISRLVLLRKV